MFIGVEVGEEHVDGETDEAIEPANDTSEHEKLSITGEVTDKSEEGFCQGGWIFTNKIKIYRYRIIYSGASAGFFQFF